MILLFSCAFMATIGFGTMVAAVVPRRRSLAAELDELLGPRVAPAHTGFWDAISRELGATMGIDPERFPNLTRDLAVTGTTVDAFLRQVVTMAAFFTAFGVGLAVTLSFEGLSVSFGIEAAVCAAVATLGAVMPRMTVRSQALERRAEMREAVAIICDLAAVLVAAGEDVDGAVVVAAAAGTGWAFGTVRAALPPSGRLGTWLSLERLGDQLGVEELVALAQNMALAEEKGAKVREALNSQARTLREEAAAEVEAKAGSMTERMSFPMVMLLAGFLLVIGYPAIARL